MCGEAASRWSELVGFIHVDCLPLEWFDDWRRKVEVDPVTKVVTVIGEPKMRKKAPESG